MERFPITLLFTMGFVVVSILLNHLDYGSQWNDRRELYGRMLMALSLGIPLSALLKLAVERWMPNKTKGYIIQGMGAALALLYYFTIPQEMTLYFGMRFAALWTLFFIAFLIVPYFYKREGLSQYILLLSGKFFLTILYAGVIFGGVSMMIFTIESLFDLNWSSNIYFDVWIIIAGAFGVTHFLGNVPEMSHKMQTETYSKIFRGLFLYILIPIISIYTVILYAYFIRILVSFELPDGIIGNLVLWYALVSVFTLFFTQDLKDEVAWLPKYFKTYIPTMVVPMLMLFIAIGIRINAYGFTMPRYFVVALALFAVFSLTIMWFKRKDTAVITMVLLMVFVSLSFFGVLSGYQVTLADQTHRLEKLLVENNMKQEDGSIVPNVGLTREAQQAISEKVDFLLRNYSDEEIRLLPEDINRSQFETVFGFKMTTYWSEFDQSTFINYFNEEIMRFIPLDGADYLLSVSRYDTFDAVALGDGVIVTKRSNQGGLIFQLEGESEVEIDIDAIAAAFYMDQTVQPSETYLSGKLSLSYVFGNFSGKHLNEGTPTSPEDILIDYYEVRILVKVNP